MYFLDSGIVSYQKETLQMIRESVGSRFMVLFSVTAIAFLTALSMAFCQSNNLYVPDIPGYVTLKCDFHTHTVFSDGNVWPTIRVQEAFKEGTGCHFNYRPLRIPSP